MSTRDLSAGRRRWLAPTVCFQSWAQCGPQRLSQPGSTLLTRISRLRAASAALGANLDHPALAAADARGGAGVAGDAVAGLGLGVVPDRLLELRQLALQQLLDVASARRPRRAVGDEGGDAPVDRRRLEMGGDLVQADGVAGHRSGDGAVDVAAAQVGDDFGEGGLDRHGAERGDPVRLGGARDPDPAAAQVGEAGQRLECRKSPAPGRHRARAARCRSARAAPS